MRILIVLAMVGAFMAPAVVVADTAPSPIHIVLAPAFAIVAPDQRSVDFILVNSSPDEVTINVKASDAWVIPAEKSFDVAGRGRHDMKAAIVIPSNADSGDHETDVQFKAGPGNGTASPGLLQVSWAVASRVLINAGGTVIRGLHVYGLTVPAIADSWDSPTINLTLDNSRGNTHEVVDVSPFGQALVLRGQTRVLALQWTQHPWAGLGTITAGGQSVSTLFLPIRAGGGLLAVLCGLWLVRRVRRTSHVEA